MRGDRHQPQGSDRQSTDVILPLHALTCRECECRFREFILAQMTIRKKRLLAKLGSVVLCAASMLGQAREGTMSFEIASTAFADGGMIPKKFTCDGPDV